ncbi:hypothetical protein GCM10009718_33950 [Isoptericola halotolerans]|uniref:Uncharacterized protein n=1 Tax=Isoptericola halotolerans TaxID=300560 RepID=A0ABX2A2J7_9MICO|nr:hypothetical protein [Isoptericola halotolerans]NOV97043.1 hypothetical protein [Isoptericola halotolerans]
MKRILASVATAALALGGLVATAMPASAHTPKVSATCKSLTVDLQHYATSYGPGKGIGKGKGNGHGHGPKVNKVTVEVNGAKQVSQTFGHSFKKTIKLDPTRSNEWTVTVDAWDGDNGTEFDFTDRGTTKACSAPERKIETAFYVYPKLDPNEDAAWKNSGKQTLIATRDGDEFWTTLPEEFPGKHFDESLLPADVCEAWGVQQDTVGIHWGFKWSDYVHITYPHGPLFKDLRKAEHSELSKYLPACSEETPPDPEEPETPEPVAIPAPSFVEDCEVENTVTLPATDLATYTEVWTEDRTSVTVTAVPAEGVVPAEGTALEWTFDFTGELCESEPVVVTPDVPTVVDLCGTENDDVELPENTDEVTYEKVSEGVLATATEGNTLGELPAEYTLQEDGTALYPVSEATFTDEPCATEEPAAELTPGDINAVCESGSPYLAYEVILPEGAEADSDNPLTISFLNPDGENHVTTDLPLEGRLLWPGASATEPLQWPGWEQLEDGSYVETDDNFAWTREAVQVLFEVNPDYSTIVDYPAASEDCADAPDNVRGPAAQTVVDIPEDDDTVRAQEVAAEDELALTGATVGIAAVVALLLIAGGVTLFVVRRRLQES